MAIHLDLKRILCCPFSAKASFLGCFAHRAISLLSVFPVICVTAGAVRLARIDGRDGIAVVKDIFGWTDARKVIWVNARPVLACVIDNHAGGDSPMKVEPRHSVGAPVLPAQEERPVSIFVKRAEPQEAAIGFDGVFVGESQVFCVCKGHMHLHCVAQGNMVRRVKSNGMD